MGSHLILASCLARKSSSRRTLRHQRIVCGLKKKHRPRSPICITAPSPNLLTRCLVGTSSISRTTSPSTGTSVAGHLKEWNRCPCSCRRETITRGVVCATLEWTIAGTISAMRRAARTLRSCPWRGCFGTLRQRSWCDVRMGGEDRERVLFLQLPRLGHPCCVV
jgi:hypothetical protein